MKKSLISSHFAHHRPRDKLVTYCSISFDAAWGGGQHAEDPECTRGLRRQGDLFRGRQLSGPVSGAGQGHRRQRLRADEPFQRTRPLQFSDGGADHQRCEYLQR